MSFGKYTAMQIKAPQGFDPYNTATLPYYASATRLKFDMRRASNGLAPAPRIELRSHGRPLTQAQLREMSEAWSRCSCGSLHATMSGATNPGGLDEYCPIHGQDIR